MKTRTETINGYTYCAYCGKELSSPHLSVWPTQVLSCDCEKAKEEIDLYEKLKALYNHPLADNLIEKKVDLYRDQLLGKTTYEISGSSNILRSGTYARPEYCNNTGVVSLTNLDRDVRGLL